MSSGSSHRGPDSPPPPPTHPAAAQIKHGQRVGGRYVIQEAIGAGGMGVVYRAIEEDIEREVALKFILLSPNLEAAERDATLQRFRHEAQALGSLPPHPNRVVLYQFGQEQDLHYMAMEMVRGQSLAEVMRDGLSAARIVSHTRQIARALVDVHASGIVHRDLKPENLIVTRSLLGDEQLKLIDFGIARSPVRVARGDGAEDAVSLDEEGDDEVEMLGTVLYMAPELLLDGIQDTRTDIYAIGVILFELITGHSPFAHAYPGGEAPSEIIEIIEHHVETEPGPLNARAEVGELPQGFEAVVRRCLAKDPEARFKDASELLRALDLISRPRAGRGTGQFRPMDRAAAVAHMADGEEGQRADIRLIPAEGIGAEVLTTAICGVCRRVASADVVGDTRVWDYETGAEVLYLPSPDGHEHSTAVRNRLAFSPDGRLLAMGDRSGKLWLIDVALGTRDQIPLSRGGPLALAFDAAVSLMVVATTAGSLELWDVPERRQLASLSIELPKADLGDQGWSLSSLALSPRRHALAAGTDTGVVYVWSFIDRSRSGPLKAPPPLPSSVSGDEAPLAVASDVPVAFLAFNSEDDRLAVLRRDGTLELWEPQLRTVLRTVSLPAKGDFRRVSFSPDGRQLMVTGNAGAIAIVDADDGEVLETIRIPRGRAVNLGFTPDEVPMASLGSGSTVQVWDLLRLGRVRTLGPYPTRLLDVTISPHGETALTLAAGGLLDRWDLCTGRHLGRQRLGVRSARELRKDPGSDRIIVCGPRDGLRAFTGMAHNGVRSLIPEPLALPTPQSDERIVTYDVSADMSLVALGYTSGVTRIFAYREPGDPIVLQGEGGAVSTLAFSPDQRILAVGYNDGRVCLWDIASASVEWEEHSSRAPARMVAFTPSGRLLSIPRGPVVEIWNLDRKRRVARLLGHDGVVLTLVYGLDGRLLLTASNDGTARLWDVAQQRALRVLDDHPGPVTAATLDPEARLLLTTSGPYLSIWRVSDAELMARLAFCGTESLVTPGEDGHGLREAGERHHWIAFTPDGYFNASSSSPPHTLMTRSGTRVRLSDEEREELYKPRRVTRDLLNA